MLARDIWPADEYVSGYTESPLTQHSISSHASYEEVCQIVGELSSRIESTGKDGQLLVLEVHQGGYLSVDGDNALKYISGWKRKRMPYLDWLKQKRYRGKMTTKTYPFVKERMSFHA